jgi:hypothetical protein
MSSAYSSLSAYVKGEIREAMYLFNSYSLDKTFDDPEQFYYYLMSEEGV